MCVIERDIQVHVQQCFIPKKMPICAIREVSMCSAIPPVADMFCLSSNELGNTWICNISKLFDTNAIEYSETYTTPLLGSSTEFDVHVCCIDKDIYRYVYSTCATVLYYMDNQPTLSYTLPTITALIYYAMKPLCACFVELATREFGNTYSCSVHVD